ncbi:protease modulator HflK [Novosphingobium sp. Gsoil 351]|uniref:protease modulator HflK n=1 Tax=Novosphingobium sp. Gsoil 351 TaxID=2675225 RepID=UPI0012B4915F|nr:protease modulator HflK [Novosphingobium sp. Gsoil 351]QGN56448.1 protease modulator HflK [Novosphingobium sp. Gsoil 351]
MAGRKNPWGGGSNAPGDSGTEGDGPPAEPPSTSPPRADGPRNPWLPPTGDGSGEPPRRSASIEDIFRNRTGTKRRGGGGGGNFPRLPDRPDGKSWLPLIAAGVAGLWLAFSSIHQIGPKEEGIVTTLGKYSRTINSGISFTAPWPFQTVAVTDVTSIRRDTIPEGEAEKLMLTGDQNLVDLSYLVRWNIKDLKLYTFQLAEPDETVKEVAEAAMRASVAEVSLTDAMGGSGRSEIEQNVRQRMQAILDAYRSGILIQGVEIKKADPPVQVVDAFKEVTAAQQDAQSAVNRAQAWAQQLTARAQGEAAEFDKVYEQYKLAPQVTRQRMYYETMERVLSKTDKTIVEAQGVQTYLPLPELKRTPPPESEVKP